MATDQPTGVSSHALLRVLLLVVAIVLLALYATTISLVLVVVFSAIVIATAINGPVTWLEQRRVPRVAGTLGIIAGAFVVGGLVAALVGATFIAEADALIEQAPEYMDAIEQRSDELLGDYPGLDEAFEPIRSDSATRQVGPAVRELVTRVGDVSRGVAALAVAFITWITMVAYLAIEPRSVLRMLLRVTPVGERDAVQRVVVAFSSVVRGWLWANVLVGSIEAVLVGVFLSWLEIPGALVWAVLAFFTVFIPKIGAFLAAAPPVIVAIAVDPGDAIWIILFYVAMTEVMSDVVLPRIQGQTMRLHPVFLVAFVLAFGSSFGLLGAVVATPLAGLVAATWNEFVVSRRPPVHDLDARVEAMLAPAAGTARD